MKRIIVDLEQKSLPLLAYFFVVVPTSTIADTTRGNGGGARLSLRQGDGQGRIR